MKARRIGVMGGMFDPVHLGHLEGANAAIEALGLDELRMIPCHLPNHREGAHASAEDRLRMLQLATVDYHRVVIDDRELRRDGVSYTVDTLASLADEFPDAVLVLVLGIDAFAKLPTWKSWQALFMLANILVLDRPGPQVEMHPELQMDLEYRSVPDAERLFWVAQGKILRLQQPLVDISSTKVRTSLRSNGHAGGDIPKVVEDYIRDHSLYENDRQSAG